MNVLCVRSGLIFSKGSGSHVHVCPRPLFEHLSADQAFHPSTCLTTAVVGALMPPLPECRRHVCHRQETGLSPWARTCGSYAVLSWAGGSRHLRVALHLVCRAPSGKRYSALFCIGQDLSDVLSWYLTSSRKSSGSGWSVSHGSCIFNVPISPWHDLHLLKFFLASILCFRLRLEGNDPPSPAPLPYLWGVWEGSGVATLSFNSTRRYTSLSRPCVRWRYTHGRCVLYDVPFFFFKKKQARVSSPPTTI